ncbi:MAG: nucleotide sugar dehydrogenase [Chloroflexota bacterium]
MTRISIFGLGYVGAVSAACLADRGVTVVGVDVSGLKVEMINEGRSPIVEEGLPELIAEAVTAGRLSATSDVAAAIEATDLSLICVGTPSRGNGGLDLTAVQRVAESIGLALRDKTAPYVVIVRSTMLPGSTETVVIEALERTSGRSIGPDLAVCYHPEFLREGSSIRDFQHPPFTIIGGDDEAAMAKVAQLYDGIEAPVITTGYRVAEMLKYACNGFHALKITFANEIGRVCKEQGIDSHEVMEIFSRDTKLNISTAYLRPGYAFGGSCLPKDLRALLQHARRSDVEVPLLASLLVSNDRQVEAAYDLVTSGGERRVGVVGLSFKPGTDDLRESPLVTLVERLIGRGRQVKVHDPNVAMGQVHGANRAYIAQELPHVVSILTDSLDELLDTSEVIVLGNASPEAVEAARRARPEQRIVDLARAVEAVPDGVAYEGIAW